MKRTTKLDLIHFRNLTSKSIEINEGKEEQQNAGICEFKHNETEPD